MQFGGHAYMYCVYVILHFVIKLQLFKCDNVFTSILVRTVDNLAVK